MQEKNLLQKIYCKNLLHWRQHWSASTELRFQSFLAGLAEYNLVLRPLPLDGHSYHLTGIIDKTWQLDGHYRHFLVGGHIKRHDHYQCLCGIGSVSDSRTTIQLLAGGFRATVLSLFVLSFLTSLLSIYNVCSLAYDLSTAV